MIGDDCDAPYTNPIFEIDPITDKLKVDTTTPFEEI